MFANEGCSFLATKIREEPKVGVRLESAGGIVVSPVLKYGVGEQ